MLSISTCIINIKDTTKNISIRVDKDERIISPVLYSLTTFKGGFGSRLFVNGKEVSDTIVDLEFAKILVVRGKVNSFKFTQERNLNLIGHRGLGMNTKDVLENTVESFNRALTKVEWVEFDVQLANNSIPVVFHDTLFYNKDSDSHHTEEGEKNIKIVNDHALPSTLDYVLKNIKKGGGINMEIKYPISQDLVYLEIIKNIKYVSNESNTNVNLQYDIPTLVDSVLDVIYLNNYKRIEFSSFSLYTLLCLKVRVPQSRIYLLTDEYNKSIIDFCNKIQLSGIVFNYKCLDMEKAKSIPKHLDIYVYDVYLKEEYDKCIAMGVKGVITDKIDDFMV